MHKKTPDGRYLFYEDTQNPIGAVGPKHYHNFFEIYLLDKGACNYFIDNKLYRVTEGDLILIPEGTLHKTTYDKGEHARRLIHCSSHFIPSDVVDKLTGLLHLYRNPTLLPAIQDLFQRIADEATKPDDYSDALQMSYMHLLFYTLVRGAKECVTVQPNNPYTEQAISYIKENFSSDITLSSLAKKLSISPEHLSRVFKKETGFGFSEYLTMLRLRHAESMLKNAPSARIGAVAYACGFNDSNYFCEKFKQIYGFPPSKLRKKS